MSFVNQTKQAIIKSVHALGYSIQKNADFTVQQEYLFSLERKSTRLTENLQKAEARIADLLDSLPDSEKAKKKNEVDYQLLMIQQSLMASIDDMDSSFKDVLEFVKPYTMTSIERLYGLYKSVEYIVRNNIRGDMMEHGVWRGGSMMLVAKTLMLLGDTSRNLYLFDTYEGHPKPDAQKDVDMWGNVAYNEWVNYRKTDETSDWALVTIDEVRANILSTGYPEDKIKLVKGMVEKTACLNVPDKLALLRLDTDWYESSRVGLTTFWPVLTHLGVLIIDDYGHYRGQREAVDEFFKDRPQLMHRVDYSCRTIQKTT